MKRTIVDNYLLIALVIRAKWFSPLRIIWLVWVLVSLHFTTVAEAQTIHTVPDMYSSIGEAVEAASDGDTIRVGEGIYTGTIRTTKRLSIVGSGRDVTIWDGEGAKRLLYIENDGAMTLTDMTLRNGNAPERDSRGGALYNRGDTVLERVTLTQNSATTGGTIYQLRGTLVLSDVTITHGTASYGNVLYSTTGRVRIEGSQLRENGVQTEGETDRGGIIYNQGAFIEIVESEIVGNRAKLGGAIYSTSAVSLDRVTMRGNQAENGGGIYIFGITNAEMAESAFPISIEINESHISENEAVDKGGGVFSWGHNVVITATGSTVGNNQAGNKGGGFAVRNGALVVASTMVTRNQSVTGAGVHAYEATIDVTQSSFAENVATVSGGGGHWVDSTVTLENNTLSGNEAGKWGSEIALFDSNVVANHLTVVGGEEVAGLYAFGSTIVVSNSIVMNGCEIEGETNVVGSHVVVDDARCNFGTVNEDVGLGERNGAGVHEPMVGSVVIGAADPTHCLPVDQLGRERDGLCDIGAAESLFESGEPSMLSVFQNNMQGKHTTNVVTISVSWSILVVVTAVWLFPVRDESHTYVKKTR